MKSQSSQSPFGADANIADQTTDPIRDLLASPVGPDLITWIVEPTLAGSHSVAIRDLARSLHRDRAQTLTFILYGELLTVAPTPIRPLLLGIDGQQLVQDIVDRTLELAKRPALSEDRFPNRALTIASLIINEYLLYDALGDQEPSALRIVPTRKKTPTRLSKAACQAA